MSARTPARARRGEVPPIFDDLSDTEPGTPRRPRTRAAAAALRQRKSETPGPGSNGSVSFTSALGEEVNGHPTGASLSETPGTPTPAPTNGHAQKVVEKEGHLSPPGQAQAWRTISRSPSPLGLIPIHRTFSSLVRSPVDYFLRWLGCGGSGGGGDQEDGDSSSGKSDSGAERSSKRRRIPASPSRPASRHRRRSKSRRPFSQSPSSQSAHRSPHASSSSSSPRPSTFRPAIPPLTMLAQIHRHEVPRKLLHVSIGGFVIYFYRYGYQPANITPWLAAALVPIASADVLRFWSPRFNAFYIRVLGALMRESEVKGWNGVVWYLVGTLSVLAVFPKDVATLSILLLSWCDTAASTFGRIYGHLTPRVRARKSLAGCIASFIVGAASAAYFWGVVMPATPEFPNDPATPSMWKGVVGSLTGVTALVVGSLWTGLVGSASEVVDIWGLDDNLIIPVLSAVGIWGFLKVLG